MFESRTSIRPARGMRCRDCFHGDKKISFATRSVVKEDGLERMKKDLIGQMMCCLGPLLLRFFPNSEMLFAPKAGDTCINPERFSAKTINLRSP